MTKFIFIFSFKLFIIFIYYFIISKHVYLDLTHVQKGAYRLTNDQQFTLWSQRTKNIWNLCILKIRACHGWSSCNGICLVSGPDILYVQYDNKSWTCTVAFALVVTGSIYRPFWPMRRYRSAEKWL